MIKLIVGIGISGSGKTTLLKEFARKYNYKYICPDDIRVQISGDATIQRQNNEVWEEAYKRLKKDLKDGQTVVFDATSTNLELRKKLLALAREGGAEKIQGVYLDIPLEVAKERNQQRERKVPDEVLLRMDNAVRSSPPRTEDGFDSVFTLDEFQRLIQTELSRNNEVKLKMR